jgi:hypothetical protein
MSLLYGKEGMLGSFDTDLRRKYEAQESAIQTALKISGMSNPNLSSYLMVQRNTPELPNTNDILLDNLQKLVASPSTGNYTWDSIERFFG